MNVLVLSGSVDHDGQTARAAGALAAGLETGGAATELVFLPELKIERCRQCEANGWGTCRSEGECAIDDDFAELVERLRAADAAVFATPVYFGDLSESLHAFLDRLRRITRCEEAKAGLSGKPAVGVCVAGGGGGGGPSCTVSLEKMLATCGFDVVDMVPARRQNLGLKLEVLRLTGEWLAPEIGGR
jgi:multimeric flavodoxin WrbA